MKYNSQGIGPRIIPQRWITPYHDVSIASTSQIASANRVYLLEFEVFTPTIAIGIGVVNAATVAGNILVGIYGPIITEETCAGSPLVVQSVSTPLAGASQPQIITFTNSLLQTGRYYGAAVFSDATHTFLRVGSTTIETGWIKAYDLGGGFSLVDPCPAVIFENTPPSIRIMCTPIV